MTMIRMKVNGQEIEAQPGQSILEVVHEHALDRIPTLCHSAELEPYGSCFLCVVEVMGRPNLVPACATRVAPDMEVTTRNERVIASRRTALELLLSNHYADCISPCMIGCPAGVDAQGYIALAAMGADRKAVDLIRQANPFPAVCGRVCVRKCEVVCRRVDVDQAVGINAIKRHVTDAPGIYDGEPEREPDQGKSIGIVGAGPAGLTAAWFLGRRGYRPVLYEAMERAGGMLRYGIPIYRLPDDVLDREIDYICRAGAEIQYGVRVGRDVSLDELRGRHDALFLAAGAWGGKAMRVDGETTTAGVVQGVDFLREKADRPDPVAGTIVVVGGGNTAMDVARTAWRCGADKVIVLYRRTKAEMPADEMEIVDCLEEGIEIMELAAPTGVIADGERLRALKCIRMRLGEPDASGRRRPVPMDGSEFELPCQMAVIAVGQEPIMEGLEKLADLDLDISRWQTINIDTRTMATNIPGVYGGGDAADDGPTVLIDAIRDGQRAARSMDAYLQECTLTPEPFIVTKEFWSKPGKAELGEIPESPRHEIHLIEPEERAGNFREVATGFEHEDTAHEADRCLSCGCLRYDDCALRLYAEEYGVDLAHFTGYVRRHTVDDRHPYISYDPNKCVLCARCIRTCARVLPISALGLVGRGFRTEMRPAMNDPLVETSCVSCGNCVDACPTGALTVKYPFPGRAALETENHETHCAFCSLACPITARCFDDGHYSITSSGQAGDYLCRYGRFGYERFVKQKRMHAPLLRSGSTSTETDFSAAYQRIVAGFRAAIEKHGAESVAVFASPELTNEELYLAARIAREGLGTNNVGSLTILETGREAGCLDASLGFTASSADRKVLADADLIICNNTATESDHLVLAADIIAAVKRGSRLIVINSMLDTADQVLAELALDPMRGRATVLWNAMIAGLVENGTFAREAVTRLPGGAALLEALPRDLATAADLAGVTTEKIRRAIELIRSAERIVLIHGADRPEDRSAGDMESIANLMLLLRAQETSVELLLPRLSGNAAGMEVAGADPAFLPGRRPSEATLPGARTHGALRERLADGSIRAALIIGEDPMEYRRTGTYFQNVEFLAAMDWAITETTRFADVALPGTTYLENEGTRCNFEGQVMRFTRAVTPPVGLAGWEVLAQLAQEFGIALKVQSAAELTAALTQAVSAGTGARMPFYWNTGAERRWPESWHLRAVDGRAKSASIPPALTHSERYKRTIREVGTARYRVH